MPVLVGFAIELPRCLLWLCWGSLLSLFGDTDAALVRPHNGNVGHRVLAALAGAAAGRAG